MPATLLPFAAAFVGEQGRELEVAGGSYEIVGAAVTLSATDSFLVTVNGGSYSLTGGPVLLEYGFEVEAAGGEYVIDGAQITLPKHVLAAGAAIIPAAEASGSTLPGITFAWRGDAWSIALVRKWDGAAWVHANVKKWNGSIWT